MKREPRFPDGCKSCWVLPKPRQGEPPSTKAPAVKTIHGMLITTKLEHNHFTFLSQEAQTGKVMNRFPRGAKIVVRVDPNTLLSSFL